MLDRVRDLVRCDSDRCDRTAIVMLAQETHGARSRIVMVALTCDLDFNVGKLGLIEQMPRELAACPRQVRTLDAMLLQDVLDPNARAEHERKDNDQADGDEDGHGLS